MTETIILIVAVSVVVVVLSLMAAVATGFVVGVFVASKLTNNPGL